MTQPANFGTPYASIYDTLYASKDYTGECSVVTQYFQKAAIPVQHVLDLGCGTGTHSLMLAERGYTVTGVDLASEMITQARRKTMTKNVPPQNISWHLGDIRTARLEAGAYDAVTMLFAVLGYQHTNQDVCQALTTVHYHLKPGGVFIFDVWYGPAVLSERPSDRVRVLHPTPSREIIRCAQSTLDTTAHTCTVQYHVITLENNIKVADTYEDHIMRYFFPQELNLLLAMHGMELLQLAAFPEVDKPASEKSWNVIGVAQKCL